MFDGRGQPFEGDSYAWKECRMHDRICAFLQHSPGHRAFRGHVAEPRVDLVQEFVDEARRATTFGQGAFSKTTTGRPASRVVDQIVFVEIRIRRRLSVLLVAGVDVASAVVVDGAVSSERHRPRVVRRPVKADVVVEVQVDVDVGR